MTPRGRESTKLCGNFALPITSIIMMLITILLMIEDRCNISFANNACYVHAISFLICDENACKTNSVIYFKRSLSRHALARTYQTEISRLPPENFKGVWQALSVWLDSYRDRWTGIQRWHTFMKLRMPLVYKFEVGLLHGVCIYHLRSRRLMLKQPPFTLVW